MRVRFFFFFNTLILYLGILMILMIRFVDNCKLSEIGILRSINIFVECIIKVIKLDLYCANVSFIDFSFCYYFRYDTFKILERVANFFSYSIRN